MNINDEFIKALLAGALSGIGIVFGLLIDKRIQRRKDDKDAIYLVYLLFKHLMDIRNNTNRKINNYNNYIAELRKNFFADVLMRSEVFNPSLYASEKINQATLYKGFLHCYSREHIAVNDFNRANNIIISYKRLTEDIDIRYERLVNDMYQLKKNYSDNIDDLKKTISEYLMSHPQGEKTRDNVNSLFSIFLQKYQDSGFTLNEAHKDLVVPIREALKSVIHEEKFRPIWNIILKLNSLKFQIEFDNKNLAEFIEFNALSLTKTNKVLDLLITRIRINLKDKIDHL